LVANDHLKGDELTLLVGFLDFYREVMVRKLDGLTEEQARWKPAPAANSLLNLIVHLTGVERGWFQGTIAGLQVDRDRDAELAELPGSVTISTAVTAYRQEWEASNEIARTAASLDDLVKGGERDRSVRWVLLHLIEETARHAGHADITRELIDGKTGFI
jgi:uncharacterized damage-inducible protein DinB